MFRFHAFSAYTNSALEGIWTPNLLIRSQMLYPLSYERWLVPALINIWNIYTNSIISGGGGIWTLVEVLPPSHLAGGCHGPG